MQLQYVFSNAHIFPRSINPVEGMRLILSYERFSKKLKSDVEFYQALARFDKFWRVPGAPRHLLQFGLLAGKNDLKSLKEIENQPEAAIRGFSSFTWTSALYRGTLEYQFPLGEVERGMPLLPVFVKRLHGSFFGDAAQYQNIYDRRERLRSVGMELRADLALGYLLEARARLGAALPLRAERGPSIFFTLETAAVGGR